MSAVTDLIALHEAQYGPRSGAPSTGGSAFAPIVEYLKKQQYEKRRQDNVKQQMSNAQQMMKAMSQMPDNSSNARAIGTLEDDVQKRRKGVISVSDYVPEQSISTDETGALNIKMGYRRATPAEQKSQYELQRSQIEAEKAQAKADLLSAYVRGEVQDGAILGEMSTLGITPDDFDVAAQARQRMQNIPQQSIPQGFEATEMTRDRMGNLIPSGIKKVQPPAPVAQPTAMDGLREEQARLNIEKTKRELEPQPVMPQEQTQNQGQQPVEQFMFKKKEPTSAMIIQKDKRTQDFIETFETNRVKKDQLNQARVLAKDIKGGVVGAMERGWMKMVDPNNPVLGKWQVIKSVLTDAQLLNTAKTKGAISDREMALFASAAANDDIASLPRMLPVFDKLEAFMNAEERAKRLTYKNIYGEDPAGFVGGIDDSQVPGSVPSVGGSVPKVGEILRTSKGTQYKVISE